MASPSEDGLVAYRIARDRYLILDGGGAADRGGRWNSPGRQVIYCGGSYAIAVLEKLVYLPTRRIPANQVYAAITIPDEVAAEALDPDSVPGWNAEDRIASRTYGDAWYDERRTAVLIVPSVVTRIDRNVLINQAHPAFGRIAATGPAPVIWDARLFAIGK